MSCPLSLVQGQQEVQDNRVVRTDFVIFYGSDSYAMQDSGMEWFYYHGHTHSTPNVEKMGKIKILFEKRNMINYSLKQTH